MSWLTHALEVTADTPGIQFFPAVRNVPNRMPSPSVLAATADKRPGKCGHGSIAGDWPRSARPPCPGRVQPALAIWRELFPASVAECAITGFRLREYQFDSIDARTAPAGAAGSRRCPSP